MGDVPGGTSRPNRSPLSLKTSLDTNELILIKAMGNKPCAERYGAPRLGLEPRTLRLTGGRPACRQAGLPLSYRGMIFDIDINERLNYNMIAPTEK